MLLRTLQIFPVKVGDLHAETGLHIVLLTSLFSKSELKRTADVVQAAYFT